MATDVRVDFGARTEKLLTDDGRAKPRCDTSSAPSFEGFFMPYPNRFTNYKDMATTIYTYLHNDDLSSSRRVSMDDCMCTLYNIKREDSTFIRDFNDDLGKPALYILLNESEKRAYIGETDNFIKRINQHLSKKGFWNEVMVFMGSNEDTLTKTEVQYLEYLAYCRANETKSYDISENTQVPQPPHTNVIQRGKADKFFKYVQFLSKFIGCGIFEKRPSVVLKTVLEANTSKVIPAPIQYTAEDLRGLVKMSLNGVGKYSKREMVLAIVKEYMKRYPETTLGELKATFRREYLGRYALYEFIQEDIETAKRWSELGENHAHYFLNDKDILTSGDGFSFAVCVEWERNNIINVLGIAKALGWTFEIVR